MAGRYEISVAANGLKNRDTFSKSDPICIMYEKRGANWVPLARTEQVKDNLNPVWQTRFQFDYNGREDQKIKFVIFDGDKPDGALTDTDFLGAVKCSFAKLAVNLGLECAAVFKDGPSKGGEMVFNLEKIDFSVDERLSVMLAAENLDKKDLISKSDPFFTISKQVGQGSFTVVHKSEMLKNTQNPSWAEFSISMRELCNGDYERPLRIDVFDYDNNGKHDLIGCFVTNVYGLQKAYAEKRSFPVVDNEKMRKKKSYKNSGIVYLKKYSVSDM